MRHQVRVGVAAPDALGRAVARVPELLRQHGGGIRPVVVAHDALMATDLDEAAPGFCLALTARRVSSATRSALMAAAADTPSAAAVTTQAMRLVTLPATHTPGTSVTPLASAAVIDSPTPSGCAVGWSPMLASISERATKRGVTTSAWRATSVPSGMGTPVTR